MNMNVLSGGAGSIGSQDAIRWSGLLVLLCVLTLAAPFALLAQDQEQPEQELSEITPEPTEEVLEEISVVSARLPNSRQMADAVATPENRNQALLDLAAAAHVLSRVENRTGLETEYGALSQAYLDDRAWLQMLVDRYGWVQPRDQVLDSAAWLVRKELQQHDLEDASEILAPHMPRSELLFQVFQKSRERLALANLPGLLLEVEADTFQTWEAFLALTRTQDSTDAAWKQVEETWFSDWMLPPPAPTNDGATRQAADIGKAAGETPVEDIPVALSKLVSETVEASPPDGRLLKRLRISLLGRMYSLAGEGDGHRPEQIRKLLYLASLIDGLHEDRYFEFAQGLLSVTSSLLETPVNDGTGPLVNWLVAELPAISAHYATDFARVDPRINSAMAASHDVLLRIATSLETGSFDTGTIDIDATVEDTAETELAGGVEPADKEPAAEDTAEVAITAPEPVIYVSGRKESRARLADAVARLSLLIPDMGYYFDTPVRGRIAEEINICISIAANLDDDGVAAMTRQQFDACMETLLQLADRETRSAELSGNMNGPFTTDTLRRELNVTPWQRINYGIGYLHDRHSVGCQPPPQPLPNPLEWAVLATTMSWFAHHSPEFVNTPENEARVTEMGSIGAQLILGLTEQASCFADAGSGNDDLVKRALTDYELALRELNMGMEQAEADFRTARLRPGADISLELDATQKTSYRPDDLLIGPCDEEAVCDMSGTLSATRALIGLFPDEYLVAEQAGMGQIEICYRNMEWVDRRSELVRADDENVANYFGHLGFDLVGRYVQVGETSDIFGFRFKSPEEYHYLFAQTSEEVLNDSCPVEWVGSRIVTPLRENRGGIVPNRLTYLASARNLPSRLLLNNWDKGSEWRDWFVTGLGVTRLETPQTPEIMTQLDQHLHTLYQAEQSEIYQRILLATARNSAGDDVSLFDEMSQVSIAKALIRMQIMLFYSESLFDSNRIRSAIAGDDGLLEGRTMRRFWEDSVPLVSVNQIALERLNRLREVWAQQPEVIRRQGLVPTSLVHALTRINILFREFFTSRPEPLQEIEVTAEPM